MSGLFKSTGPSWFTIPSSRSFLHDLAAGLLAELTADGPEGLADAILLTPTRRGARELAHAFVAAAGGGAVLLPQIRAVGDLDEGEPPFEPGDLALDLLPAASPLRRRFELARLVLEHEDLLGRSLDASGALEMADALAAVFDSLALEGVAEADDRIARLVEGEQARHWEVSARFLAVAVRRWPERLAELDLLDPTERRVRLLHLLADRWSENPPDRPLIAAGSTGTAPATARLLGVVAAAPKGCVVLPGLDLELAEDAWAKVDEQHPQGAMRRLVDRYGPGRAGVRLWPASAGAEPPARTARRRVVNEALRPAEATADWLDVIAEIGPEAVAAGLDGLTVVKARAEEDAATAIALLLREALETEGKTAALVTPDQALARRVSAKLSRWGIEADSSAGAALAGFPVGTLLGALLRLAEDPFDPVALLAAAKHPDAELDRAFVRRLERRALRGARPRSWDEIEARSSYDREATQMSADSRESGNPGLSPGADHDADEDPGEREGSKNTWVPAFAGMSGREGQGLSPERVKEELARFRALLETWSAAFAEPVTVPAAARALATALEALCGASRPWRGQAGERAAQLLADLIAEGEPLPPVDAAAFRQLVEALLTAETVRAGGSTHPRVRILGAIEARLVRADRVILAGLEEGVWPKGAPIDPFLSRPMRETLGLPAPERRVGLSAHDFAQAACAEEVVLVHCERRGGQPAVESRWLWRLRMLAQGAGVELPTRPELLDWVAMLDAPAFDTPRPAPRPKPTPPVAVRPRDLYVTYVERWVRDPYSIYARRVLGLKPMERPDESVERFARGNAVHKALERLVLAWPDALPDDCAGQLERLLLAALDEHGIDGHRMARERPLAANCARWLAEFERKRRASGLRILVERTGSATLDAPGGPFKLSAKADRIEVLDGAAAVLDFKTGQPPSKKAVAAGFYPQLPLTGAILRRGGFGEDAGAPIPSELLYVKVVGRKVAGEEIVVAGPGEADALAEAAFEGLQRRVVKFDDPATPYVSWAAPQFMGRYGGDYDHLARVREWAVVGADEGEAAA
jgi:ATP-dependent helicase/nuclease subunit B